MFPNKLTLSKQPNIIKHSSEFVVTTDFRPCMVLEYDVNHSSDASDWKTLEICDSISAIVCQKYFDVINNITFSWMACGLELSKLR